MVIKTIKDLRSTFRAYLMKRVHLHQTDELANDGGKIFLFPSFSLCICLAMCIMGSANVYQTRKLRAVAVWKDGFS